MRSIGVDFGTNFCRLCLPQREPLREAAVVAYAERSREIVAVGNDAALMLGKTPMGIRASYPLTRGAIRDPRLAGALLEHLLKRAAGRGWQKPRMVVAAHNGLTGVERRGLGRLAHDVGAAEIQFVDAAVASAVGMELDVSVPRAHLILDVGAGLSKIAIVSLGGVVRSTATAAAGDAMDEAIVRWLRRDMGMMVGDPSVAALKHSVAYAVDPPPAVHRMVGRDVVTGLPRQIEIHSDEVSEAILPVLEDIAFSAQRLLGELSPEILSDIAETGAWLVGGAAHLPGLDAFLANRLGVTVHKADDPQLATAHGLKRLIEQPRHFPLIKLKSA